MTDDIIEVFLMLVGLGTMLYWGLRLCFWIIEKLIEKSKGENK